ncbi:MAG: divergent PAP2 family protein [Hominenteromicrobium sp.]
MNFDFSVLISNPLINVGVISWSVAQLLKTAIHLIQHGEFKRERLSGAGGMPSSHSAVTCSVLLTSYLISGFDSPILAIAFILALIVMYDATGVRWAAGLHAKAINYIVEYLGDENAQNKVQLEEMIPKLNESLGHRMIEVVCGAILGFAISLIGHFCF